MQFCSTVTACCATCLAAAAALGVNPKRCAVLEGTITGVTAGVAAVFGYSPPEAGHDAPVALMTAGTAKVFTAMSELPALLTNPAFLARP